LPERENWRVLMARLLGMSGFVLLSLVAHAADDKITWEKSDAALAASALTGKPVIWYFTLNQFSKDAPPAIAATGADSALTNPVIIKRRETFHWVRGDQALANRFKVQGAPAIVITDADGDVLHRASIASPENLYDAMQLVLQEKYVDTPVAWGDVVRTGPIKKKLLVIGVEGEEGEALKSLENKTLVKYHKICEFVKLAVRKGDEDARKFSVEKTPSVVICDPMEKVLERVSGKITPAQLKAAFVKALRKVEDPRRK
jgi:thioredoxin-related protein